MIMDDKQQIKNVLIGTSEENGEIFIQTLNKNNLIKKDTLNNFFSGKEDNANISCNNLPFSKIKFNLEKTLKNEIIETINIKEIEENLKHIIDNYEYIVQTLEKKIENFKKRNNDQILLAKKLIDIYKSSLNKDNLNEKIVILNLKNIVRFNKLDLDNFIHRINSIDFNYNILKPFSLESYIEEKLLIEKVQKNSNVIFSEEIESFLILEKINKIILYSKKKIFLLNSINYSYEDIVLSEKEIISLNLLKDDLILISHPKSISELKIEKNKLILSDYSKEILETIIIYYPGIIINYKDGMAWTNGKFIGLYDDDYFDIDDSLNIEFMDYSGGYTIESVYLYQYKKDIILYLYVFKGRDHHMSYQPELRFSIYNKELIKEKKNYFIDLGYIDFETKIINYKILEFKTNKVITFGNEHIFIIDIFNFEIIKKIYLTQEFSINNSYKLKNNYYLFILRTRKYKIEYKNKLEGEPEGKGEKKIETNNIFIIKIDDDYHKILLESCIEPSNANIFFNFKNKLFPEIISIEENKNINFYEMIIKN